MRSFWIPGAVALLTISACGGGTVSGQPETTTPRSTAVDVSERTSAAWVIDVASTKCSELMRQKWADEDAGFAPLELVADNPPGTLPPSWRLRGSMSTPAGEPREFFCDLEWSPDGDKYRAKLVEEPRP